MMQAEIAVLRFGLGAKPGDLAAAADEPRAWLMAQIKGAVPLAVNVPLAPSDQIYAGLLAARDARQKMKQESTSDGQDAKVAVNAVREAYQPHYRAQVLARAQSAALTSRPFAERLVHFWSNHFAVSADKGVVFGLAGTLENEAIRPHVGGRFVDLLTAVEQHPAMIAFLDNQISVGKDSSAALVAARFRNADLRQPKRQFGINENLAREILELHTLGVNGGYSQADVTSFAEIITGWSIGGGKGRLAGGVPGRFYFRDNLHEPGPKVFLGKTYTEQGQRQGEAVLADLARRPETANFIATKLVRHFIADDPPPAAVARVARAFLKTGGDLPHVYAALIESPEAWDADARKFKTPEDFVFSTLRALNVSPAQPEEVIRTFDLLGQRQYTPGSPAGWPDTSKSWDGSDALMHRVLWASRVGAKYESGVEPTDLAASSLGSYARPETLTALRRAASSGQAVALLLMSPEFQRR
ncbi:MAG TPA: DUF1800 domain-containing protein [Steroidobacteraceae bacterium]|jgi:uncharacterized protein (DUF1800 family)|nr:DUF1800 domain-containing protein [Steroidobacteraceae bacterium]